jgi:MFS family permease
VTASSVAWRRTFASLSVRNYRLYFFGQMISLSGTWMQGVAQAWLVLKLTNSGTALGLVTALQFLPVLLLGPMGGVVADRFDKRRVLYCSQFTAGILALILGVVVSTGVVRLWMVYVLASGLGLVNTVDNPTRQTFVLEMVGPENLTNAVSLNSVVINLARVLGPAIAGVLIATVGLGPCFLINAASYLAVLAGLALMRSRDLHPAPIQPRTRGQLREGFRYVRSSPELLAPLLMLAVIGTFAYEFQVSLPLIAKFSFHGGAGTYGAMSSFMGGGAVVGGLWAAARRRPTATGLAWAASIFGGVILIAAAAPTLATELAALVLIGAASINVLAMGNTTLQLATTPEMRGRVMGLWAVAFLGSTPVGGPIVGWVGQHLGPRYGLALGGVAAILAAALAYRSLAGVQRRADAGGLGVHAAARLQ